MGNYQTMNELKLSFSHIRPNNMFAYRVLEPILKPTTFYYTYIHYLFPVV